MSTATEPIPHRVKTNLPAEYQPQSDDDGEPLATFLGVFSLGLGFAELFAPGTVSRLSGVRYPGLLRAYGLREVTSGMGILLNRRPTGWLWSRVAGDVMDLATLGVAYAEGDRRDRGRVLAAAGAVAGVTALDIVCALDHSRSSD
ncbi:MAG: hypothetical protein U0871_11575 [Gemmataceae bacterium]